MCARDGRGAIEICLSEKGALEKYDWETLIYTVYRITFFCQKTTLYLLETNNFKCTAVDSIIKLIFHHFSH